MNVSRRSCLAWLIASCLTPAIILVGCTEEQKPTPDSQTKSQAKEITFSLVIDFGNGKKKEFEKLIGHEGITVLEAMQIAGKDAQGLELSTTRNATGRSAFVEQIDDIKNEGGGENVKNWMYKINGKKGQVSAGVQQLKQGDQVLWKFGPYEVE
jgi:hypothetical protein